MSQKVEQVAAAIRRILISGGTIDSAAIAAIEAMREPSDGMVYAALEVGCRINTIDGWRAMIDQALK